MIFHCLKKYILIIIMPLFLTSCFLKEISENKKEIGQKSSSITTNSLLNRISSGQSDSSFSIGMSATDIEKIKGKPKDFLNYMGMGYYYYEGIGIFFDGIFNDSGQGVFKSNDEIKVQSICWFDGSEVFEVKTLKTTKKEVIERYGQPNIVKTFEPSEEGEDLLTGDSIIYSSDNNWFLLVIDDKGIVTSCYLAREKWFSN